jgi:hypothetical protein
MLRRLAPQLERQIEVLAGPPSHELWDTTQFALTVQSSTALSCAALGIPVFLCAWLRDAYSGYVPQYTRFGIGHVLESPEQIAQIPGLLENRNTRGFHQERDHSAINSDDLADLFSEACSLPVASNA